MASDVWSSVCLVL